MDEDVKVALIFFGILLAYLLIEPLLGLVTSYRMYGLLAKVIIIGALLAIYKKWFTFRVRFDFLALLVGLLIGFLWVGLDAFYPKLGGSSIYVPDTLEIILKLATGLIIAPIVEEFFTRYFLHRFIQAKNWLIMPLGKFHWGAFIITVLFFGFSHGEWLVGLLAGILLNLLWYKRKDMNSVVTAHATANLVLWAFVVLLGLWHFW